MLASAAAFWELPGDRGRERGNDKTTVDTWCVLRQSCREGPAQNWLILRNGSVTIGLFQGVLPRNTLTFNPGWDEKAQAVVPFSDVREHQRRLKARGHVSSAR